MKTSPMESHTTEPQMGKDGAAPEAGQDDFRCAFVSIIGAPNVGKSTLLNNMLGQKLAAVSPKPQTTRNRIMGIKNLPDGQLVFLDTAGIHRTDSTMGKAMVEASSTALAGADVALLVVESRSAVAGRSVSIPQSAENVIELIGQFQKPCVLAINKVDRIGDKAELLPLMECYAKRYPFASIVPISALKMDGIGKLCEELVKISPSGPALFPEETLTDRAERFFVAELVREQVFNLLHQELPYCVEAEVVSFQEGSERVKVDCNLLVAKESQKAILIGKGGQMIKAIGTNSRLEAEKFLGVPVTLMLHVKVDKQLFTSVASLKRLGIIEA